MESLPDEIIEMICGFVEPQDLLRVTLVNRRLRWIVENSPNLMGNLPLYLCDNDLDFCNVEFDDDHHHRRLIEPLLESNKKMRKLIIELKREKIIKFVGVFRKFSDSIRCLEIRNYAFDTLEQLRIILRYLINLQQLTMRNVTFLKAENGFLKSIVPKYDNLKTINVVNCHPRIFSLFNINSSANTQLREIRFESSVSENDVAWRFSYESLIDVVTQQRSLVKLRLDGINFELDNISEKLKHLNCRLRYLEVVNCRVEQLDTAKNIVDIIKSQKHLKSLKLMKTPLSSMMNSIGTYMKMFNNRIEDASLDIDETSMIHSHNMVIDSIKKLTLRGKFAFENLPIFVNVIKLFPNVRQLKLEGRSPINEKYLHSILTTFKWLEELCIPGLVSRTGDSNFSILQSVDNHGLRSLTLEYIDYDVKFFGWKNIAVNLRSIEKLVIKRDYGKVSKEIVDMIVKTLPLRHLELGIGIASDEIIDTVTHCKGLKVLKVASCDFQKLSPANGSLIRFFDSNRVLFYVCNDSYFAKKCSSI